MLGPSPPRLADEEQDIGLMTGLPSLQDKEPSGLDALVVWHRSPRLLPLHKGCLQACRAFPLPDLQQPS